MPRKIDRIRASKGHFDSTGHLILEEMMQRRCREEKEMKIKRKEGLFYILELLGEEQWRMNQ